MNDETRVGPVEGSLSAPPRSNKKAPESSSAAPVEAVEVLPAGHEDDIQAVIACLGDDAAGLREENPECEIAANMEVAAATIKSLCKQLDEARPLVAQPPQTVQEDERDLVKFFWENRPTSAMQALNDVMAERQRQMMVEGWTAKHDDEHTNGAMAFAAAAYAVSSTESNGSLSQASKLFLRTGWAKQWWKPRTPREDLVRAATLLLAEIERLDRAAISATTKEN